MIDGASEFFGSDIKIEVAGRIRYPDGFVLCSKPTGDSITVHRDPVVIFEILSDGTASRDIITKNREYAATPSGPTLCDPAARRGRGHNLRAGRRRLDRPWTQLRPHVLRLPEIGIELPLAELYRGVELSPLVSD